MASAVGTIVSTMLSFPANDGIVDRPEMPPPSIAYGVKVLVTVGVGVDSVALPTSVSDGDPGKMGVGTDVSDGDLVGEIPDDIMEEAGDGIDVPTESTEGSSDPPSSSISVSLLVEFFAASAYCLQ